MFQFHQPDTFRHICRLFRIKWQRLTRQCIAKLAGAGTDLPTNHESGCSPTPTLAHVRTFATGADRMHAMRLHDRFRAGKLLVTAQTDLQPIRFSQMFCHALTNFQTGSSPSSCKGGNGYYRRKYCGCDPYRRAYQTVSRPAPRPLHNRGSA